jgi:hypothetical protein
MRTRHALIIGLLLAASLAATAETLTSHFDKSFPPKPGGTLKVEASFHDVTVNIVPTDSIHVVVDMKMTTWPAETKDYLDAYAPVFKDEGNTLLVRSRAKGNFMFGFVSSEGTIAVTMPPGMNIVLDTGSGDCRVTGDTSSMEVSFDTGSGDVFFEGAAKEFKADTGSGNVTARVSGRIAKADIDTGSGDIDFRGEAASFKADTGSGDVKAEGLTGDGHFDTGSGDVVAEWSSLAEGSRLYADTGSGSVRLKIPAGSTLDGVLDTSSGDVRCDFPAAASKRGSHWTLTGGKGGSTLKVDTGSGDISIISVK